MEGDIVFVGRALHSSDGRHTAAASWWAGRGLRVHIIKNASGEPGVYEPTTGFEQGVVVHPNILFQGFKVCAECGAPAGLGAELHDFRCDAWVIYGVDVPIHKFFQAGLGV